MVCIPVGVLHVCFDFIVFDTQTIRQLVNAILSVSLI